MNLEGYEGTAIDMETFNQVDDETTVEPMEGTEQSDVVETDEPQEESGMTTEETPEVSTYEIPGVGNVSAEEVREWKNGWLRQSDYTRKTQQLASERERLRDAETLFNYISEHPELIDTIRQTPVGNNPAIDNASPDRQMLREVLYNQKSLETDLKLNQLRQQYGDIDEVAILNKAAELRTEDLDFVYKGLLSEQRVDVDEIRRQAIEEAKEQLRNELEADKNSVGNTTVSSKQSAPVQKAVLTPEQKRVAHGMGLSEEEYAKWL